MSLNYNIIDLVLCYSNIAVIKSAYPLNAHISATLKTAGFWHAKLSANNLPIIKFNLEQVAQFCTIPYDAIFRIWSRIFIETETARNCTLGILMVHDVENRRNSVNHTMRIKWQHNQTISKEFVQSLFPNFNKGISIKKINHQYYVNKNVIEIEDLQRIITSYIACRNLLPINVGIYDEADRSYLYPTSNLYRNGIWDAYISLFI